jgi:hypothetical protein
VLNHFHPPSVPALALVARPSLLCPLLHREPARNHVRHVASPFPFSFSFSALLCRCRCNSSALRPDFRAPLVVCSPLPMMLADDLRSSGTSILPICVLGFRATPGPFRPSKACPLLVVHSLLVHHFLTDSHPPTQSAVPSRQLSLHDQNLSALHLPLEPLDHASFTALTALSARASTSLLPLPHFCFDLFFSNACALHAIGFTGLLNTFFHDTGSLSCV